MDIIDKKIIRILADNAAASATEIGAEINLSVPAVNKRIAKLREGGTISRFTVITDKSKVGKPIIAFILVVLQNTAAAENLISYVRTDDDVLECYAVTGEYDYILKVCASGVEALEDKLLVLKKQKGVIKSHTMLSLMEHKFAPTPLPNKGDLE